MKTKKTRKRESNSVGLQDAERGSKEQDDMADACEIRESERRVRVREREREEDKEKRKEEPATSEA